MTSLTHLEELRQRGPKTRFLLDTPYAKALPVIFEQDAYFSNGSQIVLGKRIFISLYLCMEYLFSFDIILQGPKFYKTQKKMISNFNVEPLHEYGNEEAYLPNKKLIKVIKTKQEWIDFLQSSFSHLNLNQKEQRKIFSQINNFLKGTSMQHKNGVLNEFHDEALQELNKYFRINTSAKKDKTMTTISFITLDAEQQELSIQLTKNFNLLTPEELEEVVDSVRKLHADIPKTKISSRKRFSNFDETSLINHPDYETLQSLSLYDTAEILVKLNFARSTDVENRISVGHEVFEFGSNAWYCGSQTGRDTPSFLHHVQAKFFPHLSLSQFYKLVAKTWEENNY